MTDLHTTLIAAMSAVEALEEALEPYRCHLPMRKKTVTVDSDDAHVSDPDDLGFSINERGMSVDLDFQGGRAFIPWADLTDPDALAAGITRAIADAAVKRAAKNAEDSQSRALFAVRMELGDDAAAVLSDHLAKRSANPADD